MNVKHIYWFAYYNMDSPSVRYRAQYLLDQLAADHQVTYHIVFPGYHPLKILHFLKVYFIALFMRKPNSLIVVQKLYTRRLYYRALCWLIRWQPKYTVYDLDDAEYVKRKKHSIDEFMKRCEYTLVGSESLKLYARRHSEQVNIITSGVMNHGVVKQVRNSTFTVGWIGGYGGYHQQSMEQLIYPALKQLSFPVCLRILGVTREADALHIIDTFKNSPNITIDIPMNINWLNEDSVYQLVKTFDVGVAPLLDNEIHRSKSAFKLKQYCSAGVPVLATSIGENATFIEDGVNGYCCDSVEAYRSAFEALNGLNENEYWRLSAGALDALQRFGMDQVANDFLAVFKEETAKVIKVNVTEKAEHSI